MYTHPKAFISCKDGRKVFQSDVYQDRVGLCLIDEAHLHVIEEWGSDFLPDFERLHNSVLFFCLRQSFAPTATATQKRIQYFKENLQIKNSVVNVRHLDRCNIFIWQRKKEDHPHMGMKVMTFLSPSLRILR